MGISVCLYKQGSVGHLDIVELGLFWGKKKLA